MPSSGRNKKNSAGNKKLSSGRNKKTTTVKKTAAKRNTAGKKPVQKTEEADSRVNEVSVEIAMILLFAVAVLLMLSNFGICGRVGNVIGKFFFGLFGCMAWVFPVALFLGTVFVMANYKNPLFLKKMAGWLLAWSGSNGMIHLLTHGYSKGDTISGYYTFGAENQMGGGIVGGGIAKGLCIAFGTAGAYVILIVALLIAVVVIAQKPLLTPIKNKSAKVYQNAKAHHMQKREHTGTIAFDQLMLKQEEKETDVTGSHKESKEISESDKRHSFDEDSREVKNPVSPMPEEEAEVPELVIQRARQDEIFPDVHEIQPKEKKKNPKSSAKEIEQGIDSIKGEISQTETTPKAYQFPPITLLQRGERGASGDSDRYLRETAAKLQTTLHNFGVNVTITNVSCGPTVTRYELQPEQGVKVSKIVSLTDDIKLNLAAADIRIEAPIPGKAAVGIEVPNATNSPVMLRDLLESKEFKNFPSDLAFAVGKDIAGKTVVADIGKMPHLLIAGATGSGKSVCINTLIMSILYKSSPEDVRMIMIDPKVVELSVYNGIPHLFIPVVTDPKKAAGALNWAVAEMTDRYNKFAEYNVRDLKGYNAKIEQIKDIEDENKPKKMPKIVIIVDELADLMMVAPGEVEDAICRLAQLARAAGIHLIIATQRPSVNVITGLIKANMPSRIAFSVSSGVDSRTILDMNGAEKLLGKGDMLYYPQNYQKPARLQGSFVSDKEVGSVVEFLAQNKTESSEENEQITKMMNAGISQQSGMDAASDIDAYFADAARFIIEKDKASIGMLQRMFKIGFNRAARIMDQLSDAGVVGPEEGTKPRKVLMSMEEFENYIEECM